MQTQLSKEVQKLLDQAITEAFESGVRYLHAAIADELAPKNYIEFYGAMEKALSEDFIKGVIKVGIKAMFENDDEV